MASTPSNTDTVTAKAAALEVKQDDTVSNAAAEKAFAEAADAKVVQAPIKQAPVKKAPVKKASAKKAAPKKTATSRKAIATKTAPVKVVAKKASSAVKKTVTRKTSAAAKKAAAPRKETTMTKKTTQNATAENMTARAQELFGDMSGRAKSAFAKGSEYVSQATEFSKANVEALVESGKIAAKGVQDMGQAYASDTRHNFEEITATMKQFAGVKSPTEFFQLQSETLRKTFDTAISQTSKNTEMFVKVAGEAFQPISNRVSVAVETFKKAA